MCKVCRCGDWGCSGIFDHTLLAVLTCDLHPIDVYDLTQ